MIIYFADRKMNIINMVTSELTKDGINIISDKKIEEIEYGSSILELVISYTKASREVAKESTKAGNYILVQHGEEAGYYTIIEREDNALDNEIAIYAENAGLDLLNEVLEPYTADKEYDIAYYVNKFIYDSGFEIHLNELTGVKKQLSWGGEDTATSRVLSVASAFECEIGFSFIVEGMSVMHKYINIYKQRGTNTFVELRFGREIDNIVIKHTIENLATAFMNVKGATPEGAQEPITLSGYLYDDGDIYIDGTWLKSRNGLQKWSRYLSESGPDVGHVVRTFTYNTTSQAELCAKAVDELKKVSDVEINYEITISDLPDLLSIGDTVNIIDDDGKLYLSARILKLESSRISKNAVATLGEYLIKEDGISQKLEALSDEFKTIAKNRVFYTWIAYADDEHGNGISLEPDEKKYMGISNNQTKETPSIEDPTIYTWIKVKGDTGEPPISIILTPETYTFLGNTDSVDGVQNITIKVLAFRGSEKIPCEIGNMETPIGISAVSNKKVLDPNITITATPELMTAGSFIIPVIVENITINKIFSYAIAFKGTSITVKSTSVTYQTSKSGTTIPTGTWGKDIPNIPAGRYLWSKTEVIYSDNNSTITYSVAHNGSDGSNGEDALNLVIESSSGIIFKNTPIVTILTAHVYKGGNEITGSLLSSLGVIKWYRDDGSTSLLGEGTTLKVNTSTDINKVVYMAKLEDKNMVVKANDFVTLVKVNDGSDGNSGIIVSSTAPSNPVIGQLWQTETEQPIKRWNGSSWVIHYISIDNIKADTLSAIAADLGLITAGSMNINDKFIVDRLGSMKATSGEIAGWTINDTEISTTNATDSNQTTMKFDSKNNTIKSTLLIKETDHTYLDVAEFGLAVLNMYRTMSDESGDHTQTTSVGLGCIEMNDEIGNHNSAIYPDEFVIGRQTDQAPMLRIKSNSIVASYLADNPVGSIYFNIDNSTGKTYINLVSDLIKFNGKELFKEKNLYMVSGTKVLTVPSSNAVKVHTWEDIVQLFKQEYDITITDRTKLGISFINGDSSQEAHVEGGTWVGDSSKGQGDIHAVLDRNASGSIRINYSYFYVM